MLLMLLQLCVVIVIQMTSSQPTCDVIQPGSDVCGSRGRTEQTLNQLMMVLSQFRQNDVQTSRRIEHVLNQLGTFLSQSNNRTDQFSSELATLVSQLRQSDVANSSSRADSPNQLLSELVPISCQLQTAVSQLQTTASRLQKDIAQLKAATLPTNTSECPANFTYVASVQGCYSVVTRQMNWTDAGRTCRSLHRDAHLLVINDAREQAAIFGMLASTSVYSVAALHECSEFWTAGESLRPSSHRWRSGPYVWRVMSSDTRTDTVIAMTYTNWHRNPEPFNAGKCATVNARHGYKWDVQDCRYTRRCSLCELDIIANKTARASCTSRLVQNSSTMFWRGKIPV